LKGIYVGVPVIIGKDGVERIVEIDFELDEKEMFDHSISAVKQLNEVASKFEAE
ncbi:MAG: malate dehydrogenase, partial [Alphaproteobacteria bacterium]|nr:malate dehydrogenase [Alphaproteobacteria bacterium]